MRKIILALTFCLFAGVLGLAAPVWADADADLLAVVDADNPDFDRVETLLNNGADPNAADETYESALMKAARRHFSDISVAELLIGFGADINAVDFNGQSALMKAAQYNPNARMVELIGRLGADVDLQDGDGETALMKACTYTSNEEVVTILLLLESDTSLRNVKNKTAYDLARQNKSLKGTETLTILKDLTN